MSFQLVQACIDMRGGLLTPAQKASLLVICRFADDKGMNSFPKLETIAERTEFNRRTILEAVKGLIENGWITAVRTQYGRNFSVSVNKIMANKADIADVQKPAHVQETTSRCAGSCTADVQEPAHRREQLKEQEKNSTVNDVYGKRGLPSTTITDTVNDVYGKGKQRLPITDKEQIKNRQVLIGDFHPRAEVQGDAKEHPRAEVTDDPVQKCTPTPCKSAPLREHIREQEEISNDSRDLFDDSDQKVNRGAAKTKKTQRNSLIQKENRGAPLMAPSPADSASEIASKSLIQKENEGADTPARTSVKKPAKKEPQGSRFTLKELPDEWHSECRRIQPKADPAKVFEEFRDHWIAQPGAKGRKSDWIATWRNWCRRINARDLERVGYEPERAQFMVKPEPVNPFKVTPQNCPPRQKTEEELEAERSFDLFERVLNGEV